MSSRQFTVDDLMDVLVQGAGLPTAARTRDAAATLADVGLDSLAYLQLQTELVVRYGIEIPDGRRQHCTVGEIVRYVNTGAVLGQAA